MQTSEIAEGSREYLTFRLGNEEYGIDILKVQEIRRYDRPTTIAGMPAFIRGVIDLRGLIVPIIDLRMKFALERADYDDYTVVIILNVAGRIAGVVVDLVSDVVTLAPSDTKAMPEFAAIDTHFHTGIGRTDDRMIILLDIERMMTSTDMHLIDAASVA
jgi:purine-binding chemotaxis protein CheW